MSLFAAILLLSLHVTKSTLIDLVIFVMIIINTSGVTQKSELYWCIVLTSLWFGCCLTSSQMHAYLIFFLNAYFKNFRVTIEEKKTKLESCFKISG